MNRRFLSNSIRVFSVFLIGLFASASLQAVTISEIMYSPRGEVQKRFEFIELYNENPDPLDLSGYAICDGISFVFPEGTWMEGNSFLVVCADQEAIRALYAIDNTVGNWAWDGESGNSLSNGGEDIEICNPGGRTVLRVKYNDRGKWPVGADGLGHSLELFAPYTDQDDPDSWIQSSDPGGSPGGPNPCWEGVEVSEGPSGPGPIYGDPVGLFHGQQDIGEPCTAGGFATRTVDGVESYEITGSGDGIGSGSDQLHFGYLQVRGNFDLRGRLASRNWLEGEGMDRAGIMARRDLTDSSAFVFVHDSPEPDGARILRRTTHGSDSSEEPVSLDTHPEWYRLRRSADSITCYYSTNGRSWRAIGSFNSGRTTWNNGDAVYVGFALTSSGGCGTSSVTWEDVQLTGDVISSPGDGTLPGEGEEVKVPEDPGGFCRDPLGIRINEGFFRGTDERWIELYNSTSGDVDLAGYYLTDDRNDSQKVELAVDTVVPAGGYLVVTEAALGLDLSISEESNDVFLALIEPTGGRVVDAVNFRPSHDGKSESRVPDGGEMRDAAEPTPGVENRLDVETGIVIAEIMYHPISNDRNREFVELYNRSDAPVDLTGWEFTSGFEFSFPDNTVVAPGGYLVVGRDPVLLRAVYSLEESSVLGPVDEEALDDFGSLSDRGERITLQDGLGRTTDTVRYFDGGEWPRWADGHGSSIELIDPLQDNRFGMAWDASDDSDKSEVTRFSYTTRHRGGESELHLLLLSRGITVVDNVSVLQGGAASEDIPIIDTNETWAYFKGTRAPPANWKALDFDDSDWLSGRTGIGYGDGDDETVLNDMRNNYLTIFCRKTFTVDDPEGLEELVFQVTVDDGFYAYLNGTQVASYNVNSPAHDALASSAGEPSLQQQSITNFRELLNEGENVLAVQVHNGGSMNSSDLSFIPRLVNRVPSDVVRGDERLVNPTFNSNASGWTIQGTHVRSGRSTTHSIDGAGSLKIIASGRGDNKVNRIESANSGVRSFSTQEDQLVVFDAKWHVGSQTINTHGYKHEMAKTHELAVPENLGSPGGLNSVTRRLQADGAVNLGPVMTDLVQTPQVPVAGEQVRIQVRAADSDGVESLRLRWSVNNPTTNPSTVEMTEVGGGAWEAVVPAQSVNSRVIFFIEATDASGNPGRFPVDIAERSHPMVLNPPTTGIHDRRYFIYSQESTRNPSTRFHDYRFHTSAYNESRLGSRRRLSNDLVDGSFSFGGTTIYHEAAMRFSGSPWARGSWNGSFRVVSPRDKPINGWIRKFNLEDHHNNPSNARERIAHYLLRLNQGTIAVPYSEVQSMARWQVNTRITTTREHVWVPDTQYVGLWFDEADGDFIEMDDRFVINDSGDRTGSSDGYVRYPPPSERRQGDGSNKENYRWFFGLRAKNGADDFTNFMEFCRLMDPAVTNNAAFESQVWDKVNVEEMLRIWAIRFNQADWDTWGTDRGKNCYFYQDGSEGRWHLLAWDMELTFETGRLDQFLIPSSPNSAFRPSGGKFAEVDRMFQILPIKKLYYGILDTMVNGDNAFYSSTRLNEYMTKLDRLGMNETTIGKPNGYIDQRRNRLRTRIASVSNTAFRISTRNGADFSTAEREVSLAGTGPARLRQVLFNGESYQLEHTSMTAWRVDEIPLGPGENLLELLAIDLNGNVFGADSITVTSTAVFEPPTINALGPAEGVAGDTIEIRGENFLPGITVFFGDTLAPSAQRISPTKIIVEVPEGSGAVEVTVRNSNGQEASGVTFTYIEEGSVFVRGDANNDGAVDISDAVAVVGHLFLGMDLGCQDAADADDDEQLVITDAVYLLDFLFRSGAPPAPPYPASGTDPDGDILGCDF